MLALALESFFGGKKLTKGECAFFMRLRHELF